MPQVAAFGKTTLGLTYSLVLGEAVLSPAIPSVAARAGGIFFPLAKVGAEHVLFTSIILLTCSITCFDDLGSAPVKEGSHCSTKWQCALCGGCQCAPGP